MNRDSFWFWLLLGLLALGMLATLWFGRGKTRHGYGFLPLSDSDHLALCRCSPQSGRRTSTSSG